MPWNSSHTVGHWRPTQPNTPPIWKHSLSSGVTGNGLGANGWLSGWQADDGYGHSHPILSTTVAANPLILRAMEWNAHKAFRLLKRAQLHLRAAKAVEAVGRGQRQKQLQSKKQSRKDRQHDDDGRSLRCATAVVADSGVDALLHDTWQRMLALGGGLPRRDGERAAWPGSGCLKQSPSRHHAALGLRVESSYWMRQLANSLNAHLNSPISLDGGHVARKASLCGPSNGMRKAAEDFGGRNAVLSRPYHQPRLFERLLVAVVQPPVFSTAGSYASSSMTSVPIPLGLYICGLPSLRPVPFAWKRMENFVHDMFAPKRPAFAFSTS
ncbi:hypothetical protein BKA61DRAFT_708696 [Leptodontidium sp. MPI-SDFR-AT-0119]|nr:hypothetical protein BKA61DRAFT_708696 [Leptodontidium sp. MPI-SDFR-AT-0119]